MNGPRTMVVGLGGIGGTIAGILAAHGRAVTVVSRNPEIRAALQRDGFRLSGVGGDRVVPCPEVVATPEAAEPGYALILLATQPPQVEAAAKQVAPALTPNGAMVVLQNGLCEERVARIVGAQRVIGGIIAWGASMVGPGAYRRTSGGGFTVGRLTGPPDALCRAVAELVAPVGNVRLTDNLRGARWTKLAFNCAVSTLGTVGGQRLGPLIRRSFVRRLALEVMTEVVQVAHADGVRLEKLAGVDLRWLTLTPQQVARPRAPVAKHAILWGAGFRYRHLRSSMLSAIERGRPPAVDFLNGEVVTRADQHGLSVPVNRALTGLVHDLAEGRRRPDVEHLRQLYEAARAG